MTKTRTMSKDELLKYLGKDEIKFMTREEKRKEQDEAYLRKLEEMDLTGWCIHDILEYLELNMIESNAENATRVQKIIEGYNMTCSECGEDSIKIEDMTMH